MELEEVVAEESLSKCHRPKMGDMVIYVHKVDDSPDPIPNLSPAIITKVHAADGLPVCDLFVMFYNGEFHQHRVVQGACDERGTWHFGSY